MSVADPVVVALLNRLPSPGTFWPLEERLAWLQALEAAFNLIYGREPRPIFINAAGVDMERLKDALKQPGRVMLSMDGIIPGQKVEGFPADEEVKIDPPEPPKVDPPKQVRPDRQAPHPRVGARRPEGIPTTFTMIQTVLKETTVALTARDVMAAIEKRWWPDLGPTFLGPDISSFISMGRLTRDADGKLSLTEKGATMVSADLRHSTKGEFQTPAPEPKPTVPEAVKAIVEEKPAPHVLPKTPVRIPMPAVKPTMGPRPSGPTTPQPVKFDHGELTTYLPTMRSYVLAGKLRAAMGKGHVSEAFLAEQTIGSNTESNRMLVKDLCLGMNEALSVAGLKIEHHPGYGLLMKDVD